MKRTFLLLVIALVFAGNLYAQSKSKSGKIMPVARGASPESVPNVLVDISAPLIDAILRRSVDRNDMVDEIIQDAPVTGTSRTIGVVTAEVVPDSKKAVVELVFRGQVFGDTTATRTFVQADCSAVTQLEVRRRIVIDSTGIQSLPGANFGRTNISLVQIKPRLEPAGIVVRLATEKFRSSRGDAEFETSTKSAWNTSRKMHTELVPALSGISKAALQNSDSLKKAGLATRELKFNSTSGGIQAHLLFGTAAGDIKPSPTPSKGVDLGVRVHESVINELARATFGGKSFSLDEIQKLHDGFAQELLRDGRSEKEQKEGQKNLKMLLALSGPAVTFAERNPLTITFTEQGLTVEINIASMQYDKKAYEGMRIKADYRLEHAKEGIVLARKSPIKFLAPTPSDKKLEALPLAFTVLRETLFAELLKERLVMASLPMPEPMRNVRVHPPRAGARDGWFALAWTLAP